MEKIRLLKFRFLVDPPTPFVVFLLSRYIHYFALSISAITLWFPKFVSVLCTSSMRITFQVTMARLYNWDVKRRKDQKAVAANWKENLIQPKAEKKTWFSWKLKRKTCFSWKLKRPGIQDSADQSLTIVTADLKTMFSRFDYDVQQIWMITGLIQIPCNSDQNWSVSWKTFNTMMNRSTNSNSEVKENICQDDSYWSTADCQMEN